MHPCTSKLTSKVCIYFTGLTNSACAWNMSTPAKSFYISRDNVYLEHPRKLLWINMRKIWFVFLLNLSVFLLLTIRNKHLLLWIKIQAHDYKESRHQRLFSGDYNAIFQMRADWIDSQTTFSHHVENTSCSGSSKEELIFIVVLASPTNLFTIFSLIRCLRAPVIWLQHNHAHPLLNTGLV